MKIKSGLLDVLTGVLGLVFLLVLAFSTKIKFDLRWFFSVAAACACASGFVRGKTSTNPWLSSLLVASGLSLPILILSLTGMAFTDLVIVAALLCVFCISVCCGVFARRGWLRQKRIAAVTFSVVPTALTACMSIFLLPAVTGSLSGQHVNLPAVEFSLVTDEGRVVHSSAMRGEVVVLAFWATWCEPCWQELPKVEKVYASYKGNRKVVFWAVNAHAGGDTDETARAWAAKMRLGLPLALTENANAARLGADGYPALVLLDTTGRVRFIHHGYDASEPLESNLAHEIDLLLNERI